MNACILKYIELVLTVTCVILHHYSYDLTDVTTLVLCSGTFVGFLVLLSGEIIGDTISAPIDLVLDMYYSAVGCGLFWSCGTLLLHARLREAPQLWPQDAPSPQMGDESSAIALAALCLVQGTVLLLDLVLAYFDAEEYDEDSII